MTTYLTVQQTYLSDAFGVNDSGEQAGTVGSGSFGSTAAVWEGGSVATLSSLGGTNNQGMGINNAGEVVGSSETSANAIHAVSWTDGIITDLSAGWFFSSANAVNDKGDIAGSSATVNQVYQAELWVGGKAVQLGDLGGGSSIAYDLNDSDQVVGKSAPQHSASHAFLWRNGVMTDLGTLGGSTSEALGINNAGLAVGDGATAQGADHAALWQAGHARDLGTLGGATSGAVGIDTAGQVVGESAMQTGASHAFVWENGVMIDLNALLAPGSGWVLQAASAISAGGVVIGYGTDNGLFADFALTLPSSGVTQTVQSAESSSAYIGDSAQNISNGLDSLQALTAQGSIKAIGFSDSSTPVVTVTYAQLTADAAAIKLFSGSYDLAVSDSGATISSDLGALEQLAQSGKLAGITLSGGGIPSLSVTAGAFTADAAAIDAISGYFTLTVTAPAASGTVAGAPNPLGNTMVFTGDASQYAITPSGDGAHFTVTGGEESVALSDFQALQFNDATLIVTQTPGPAAAPTSGNIAELYAAVFGRLPDVPGLAYYEKALASTPGLSLASFAQEFLASPEYQNNSAHAYAPNGTGDTQFIMDLYGNLLHRAPASGDAAWYEANVIAPLIQGLTPGTSTYAAALAVAHADVVTDFSQSAEFLNDVQVTPQKPAGTQHWLVLI